MSASESNSPSFLKLQLSKYSFKELAKAHRHPGRTEEQQLPTYSHNEEL